jgi:hypothetical protein
VKPAGCLLAAPEYPLTNQTSTGSVNIFDPNLQVPYSDTWTVGFQRSLGQKQAIEIRYVGTRSRQQWENFNYNEADILNNKFLDEFKLAQANLQSHIAAGCGGSGNACSFAYRGPGTGTSPLPIYLAFFSAVRPENAGNAALYTSTNFTNSSFVNPLGAYNSNPFTPAGTNSTSGLAGDPTRQANSIAAGLPANFFRANPDMLGGANATGNRGFSKYNSMQLQYRRRLSDGLQFDANYAVGRGLESTHYSFRVPRLFSRVTGGEGDISHAFKATGVYELPFGQGRRYASNINKTLDYLIGSWQMSGTTRIQTGRLADLGNVRVVGMDVNDVPGLFKMRKVSDTVVYFWPQDIIDETIKAYSTSATTATGYGSLGTADGTVLCAREHAAVHRDDQQQLRRLRHAAARRDGTDVPELRPERAQADRHLEGYLRVQPRHLQRAEPRELEPNRRRRQHDAGELAGGPARRPAVDADRHQIYLVTADASV